MKSLDAVQARAKQYVEAELKSRLFQASKRLPVLCQHNHRQSLDTRKLVEGDPNPNYNKQIGPTIGLCMFGAEGDCWQGTICEDDIDAQVCAYFTPMVTRGQVLDQFKRELADPSWVEMNLPALYELTWVLDDTPEPRWWVRLWCFLFRIKLEPIRPSLDPSTILNGQTEE